MNKYNVVKMVSFVYMGKNKVYDKGNPKLHPVIFWQTPPW